MNKSVLIFLLLLPVLGFSQVNLASWAFTANSNATNQTYITPTYSSAGGNISFSASGLLYGNNGDGSFQDYNYIEVAITPTTGMINVTSLDFSHARAAFSGNSGSTNYRVKYYISNGETLSNSDFVSIGVTAVADELITANPNKSIAINKTLTSSQKLIVRLYPRGGQWDNNAGWRINANTMKFKGTQLGPLAGTYYINSASTPNFASLSAAASAINALGMTAPVTFLLDNNTLNAASGETFPIVFNQFTGSSATNTLTIKPNVGKTPTITAATSGITSVFKIDGGDNIIFDGSNATNGTSKDWTILNASTSDISKTVIWIASNAANAATNIKIQNTTLVFGSRTADYRVSAGVFMGNTSTVAVKTRSTDAASSSDLATAANSKIVVQNNVFTNVLQGVYMAGSTNSALRTNDVTVSFNTFGSTIDAAKPAVGVQMVNIDNFNITDNIMNGLRLASNAGYETIGGIFIDGGTTFNVKRNTLSDISFNQGNATIMHAMQIKGVLVNGVISENKITNVKNTGGTTVRALELELDANTASNLQVYNNVIADISTNGGNARSLRGINIISGKGIKLYHNSVVLTGSPGGSSAALYLQGGSELDIRDNIFGNQSSGTPFAIYSEVSSSVFTEIDYNDYFTSGTFMNYLGGARNTIAAWQAATGKDANSLKVTPSFSTTDLRLTYPNTVNSTLVGTSLISTDYDATVRTIPTMGAYEYRLRCTGTTTTWNGTAWSNGTPTSTTPVIINGNYNTGTNGNINACELTVNTGFTLTISSLGFVKVENGITTSGTGKIIVQNNGNLIQVDDTAAATSPGLNVVVIRTSTPLKYYDYTYWSSPVVGAILDTVSAPSLFYEWDASVLNTGQWVNLSWAYVMLPGAGYIARAPTNLDWANNPTVTATFSGRVNSGVVTRKIYKNGTSTSNLIGNPYPSSLDAKEFLLANQANITGNIYFWTHSTAISGQAGQIQTYTADDYATYNLTGSTGTGKGNNGTNGEVVSHRPTGQIASGQAFFIDAINNNVDVRFTNSMRTGGANTQFFRGYAPTRENGPAEKSRAWLSLTNDQGAYSEALVGYIDNATNDLDNLFDAVKFDGGNYVSLYSTLGADKLVIQGRALPFSNTDIVPLGYNSTVAGTFKITLEDFDGIFAGQDIYLLDKLTDVSTKLTDGAYTFTTAIGTFDNRFELRYTNATLGVENPIATNGVVVFAKANHIEVKSDTQEIQSIAVYDLLGRSIYANDKIGATEFTTKELGFQSQVVIVKVKMADNSELTKKVILK